MDAGGVVPNGEGIRPCAASRGDMGRRLIYVTSSPPSPGPRPHPHPALCQGTAASPVGVGSVELTASADQYIELFEEQRHEAHRPGTGTRCDALSPTGDRKPHALPLHLREGLCWEEGQDASTRLTLRVTLGTWVGEWAGTGAALLLRLRAEQRGRPLRSSPTVGTWGACPGTQGALPGPVLSSPL